MTFAQAGQSQIQTSPCTVGVDGFLGVGRAARIKTALATEPGAQHQAVTADQEEEQGLHGLFKFHRAGRHTSWVSLAGFLCAGGDNHFPVAFERFAQRRAIRAGRRRARNHHQIQARQYTLRDTEIFAHAAFDPVAHHCLGRNPARHRHPHTCVPQTVGTHMHTEKGVTIRPAGAGNFAQFTPGTQAQFLG